MVGEYWTIDSLLLRSGLSGKNAIMSFQNFVSHICLSLWSFAIGKLQEWSSHAETTKQDDGNNTKWGSAKFYSVSVD